LQIEKEIIKENLLNEEQTISRFFLTIIVNNKKFLVLFVDQLNIK
jgi:hypothetical protein